jgi:hypothetical protein
VVIGCYTNSCNSVESWELHVKLPPPNVIVRHREVEVTSVNWENEDAAAVASQVLVSYRWHGIVYAVKLLTAFSPFISRLVQMLGAKKKDYSLAVVRGGMVTPMLQPVFADMIINYDLSTTVARFPYLQMGGVLQHLHRPSTLRCESSRERQFKGCKSQSSPRRQQVTAVTECSLP